MKRIGYFMICLWGILACTQQQDYRRILSHAQEVVYEHPDSSLAILDTLGQHADEFDQHFRMQYLLALTYAQAKVGVPFTTDSLTRLLVRHFDNSGSSMEQALAYYMHGCALSDIGQAPEALQAYYDAIDKADTTKTDRDCRVLRGIYGQMVGIFHQQNLPHDEIWALKRYIDYTKKTSGEEEYIIAKGQMIRPYFQLGEKDSILNIIYDKYHALKRLGKDSLAASGLSTAVYIYMERGQMDEARKAMEIFEQESGVFDSEGNIAAGREGYYFTKGFYELASKHIDSAERYFRKAIRYGYLSEGYRGLLRVYREKHVMDSVLLFSERYEAAQDSLHNQMQIEATQKMASLYNYSRSQKAAEQEAQKARNARLWVIGILVAVAVGVILIFYVYRDYKKKKQAEIDRLTTAFSAARKEYQGIQDELRQLKAKDYEKLIAEKELKEKELKQTIEELANATGLSSAADRLSDFEDSDIAKVFRKKKDFRSDNPIPNKAEWRALEVQFSKDMPVMYQLLAKDKRLSPLELQVCILIILDFEDGAIASLTDSIPQTVSNAKARANRKIFDERGAQTLKASLLQLIKAV